MVQLREWISKYLNEELLSENWAMRGTHCLWEAPRNWQEQEAITYSLTEEARGMRGDRKAWRMPELGRGSGIWSSSSLQTVLNRHGVNDINALTSLRARPGISF